jgi:long-chain acyl-CoA synthetase
MVLLPLHHAFPLIGTVIAPLYIGATIHIAEEMNAESILKTLARGKISIIVGVPRLYDMLAKGILEKINASILTKGIYKIMKTLSWSALSKIVFRSVHEKFGGHVQYLVSGGAALSDETAALFKALGLYVLDGYGMTETAPMISFTRPGKRKIGYVGDLLPGIQAKFEENGELCVKGDNVMQGYYNRPEETAEIIRDGWLHTGDMAKLDEDGFIFLVDRKKDVIISGGENLYPVQIESFLAAHPKIHDVAVIGLPDKRLGEIAAAIIQVKENMELTEDEVNRFCIDLPRYKRPRKIIFDEVLRNPTGKIDKPALRAKYNSTRLVEEQNQA